jgi:DNA-binding transcriptional MerR regulator
MFTKTDIMRITDLKPRQVQYWTEEGMIEPDIDQGIGRGKVRQYSRDRLFEFLVAKKLADKGLTLRKIEFVLELIKGIASEPMQDLGSMLLIVYTKPNGRFAAKIRHLIGNDPEACIFRINDLMEFGDSILIDLKRLADKAIKAVPRSR